MDGVVCQWFVGLGIVRIWACTKFQLDISVDSIKIYCNVSLFVVCLFFVCLFVCYAFRVFIFIIAYLTIFIVWLHFRVLPSLDRIYLEASWLFFLLSLIAGVESLVVVLVWFGVEMVWSFIIMSWLLASSDVFTSSSESGGSVCLRLAAFKIKMFCVLCYLLYCCNIL